MMHVFRVTYEPFGEKNREAIAVLKERVEERRSLGARIFMMSKMINSEGGAVHQLVSFWDSLDDFEEFYPGTAKSGPDQATMQFFEKMTPLLRGLLRTELWQVLQPVATPPMAGEYAVRQAWYPAQGAVDFGGAISELTRSFQAQGNNIGLYRQVFAPDGVVFQGIFPLKKLSDWDALLGQRNDEVFRFLRTFGAQTRKPVSTELWKVVTDPS